MPVQNECVDRANQFEETLKTLKKQWLSLEEAVGEADSRFLESRLSSLEKWFCIQPEDLEYWGDGSLRSTVRERVHRLLVTPIEEKMNQRVNFRFTVEDGMTIPPEATISNITLMALLLFWHVEIAPVLATARKEESDLAKRIKKLEKDEKKQGIMALNGDTKRVSALKKQRAPIWEPIMERLEAIAMPMQKARAFLEDELSQSTVDKLVGSAPSIICRALCDWHFEKCLVDFDQLQEWWKTTRSTLQGQDRVWQRLHEKEGYLVKRIERGLEDLKTRRSRYSMYATFGGSEIEVMKWMATPSSPSAPSKKLEESMGLLASVVSDMQKRLKAIRDSALWRVIDTSKDIYLEQREEDAAPDRPAWESVSLEEGEDAIFEDLQDGARTFEDGGDGVISEAVTQCDEGDVEEAVLVIVGRLEKVVATSRDVAQWLCRPPKLAGVEGACDLLEGVATFITDVNEDLLAVLDNPTRASAKAWTKRWSKLGAAGEGGRLDELIAGLALPTDAHIAGVAERKARRRWLALARGLQALLSDSEVRARVVAPFGFGGFGDGRGTPGSRCVSPGAQDHVGDAGAKILELSKPPSPRSMEVPSDTGYRYQPPERATPRETPRETVPLVLRPATPSTTDDDGTSPKEASRLTTSKFIDGKLVEMRPGSAGVKLVPLGSASPKFSTGRGRPSPGGGGGQSMGRL
eukprot:TRINITY_DN48822_c0_g1_i1.p1 TRINITY_DN48822_c0_g1~~TRINITY_DN48822_c0_g1_i1.p1  ORF type:complete len:691 (-),score=134.87 TRINITY_DN48822_c0_g1_i1:39-2111(-)